MAPNKVKSPRRTTPRKRFPPKQGDFVIVDKPSAHCPNCRKFVPEEGVVCPECNAFWHYTCADVTQEEIENDWKDRDFLCSKHRCLPVVERSESSEDPADSEEVSIRVHVNSYTLNPESTIRKLLSSLNCQSKVEPRDKNQQYYVKLCLPTFQILVANLIDLGKQWGITIKQGGTDKVGTKVGTNFDMELCTNSGLKAGISINCHNTKSSIHIQLNKGAKSTRGWEEKVSCLSHFVYNVLGRVITQIESTDQFALLKEDMRAYLTSTDGQAAVINSPENGTLCRELVIQHLPTGIITEMTNASDYNTTTCTAMKVNEGDTIGGDTIGHPEKLEIPPPCDLNEPNISSESLDSTNDNGQIESKVSKLQDSLQDLRLLLKDRNDEITKLKSENSLKKLQKELEEKVVETEAKDEKISKIMAMKEQLGNTIQSLKEKLVTANEDIHLHNETISKHEETIKQQNKVINELTLRSDCNKEVATLFMDEVLDGDDDCRDSESVEKAYQEQVAKLFKDLSEEREKTEKCLSEKREVDSELASLQLIREEEKTKERELIGTKDKEIKSLKTEIRRLDTAHTDLRERNGALEKKVECLEKGIEDHNTKNNQYIMEIERLKNTLATQEKESQEVLWKISEDTQTEPLDDVIRTLETEKSNLRKSLATITNTNKQLTSDIEMEKKKYTELFLIAESVKAELSMLRETTAQSENGRSVTTVTNSSNGEDNELPENVQQQQTENVIHGMGNICFIEFMEEGSCNRPRCNFQHNIKPEMRASNAFINHVIGAKEERAAKCVNEFFRTGSCRKGKSCRFSHTITENHRRDPSFRKNMEEKYYSLTGRIYDERHGSPAFSANPSRAFAASSNIVNITDRCHTNENPRLTHQAPHFPQHFPTDNQSLPYQSRPPLEMTNESPRPLMENLINHPAQMQAINLLQNILSNMMVSQFNVQPMPQEMCP